MAFCQRIGCRKRAHSEPDDCEECMPISKRINKLHIRHSAETWEEAEHEMGGPCDNNVPDQETHCVPTTNVPESDLQSFTSRQICRNAYTPVQIPGLPLTLPHYTHTFPTPDINHNNPLLSPMPRQPCPSSVAARQSNCSGSFGLSMAQNCEQDNPYYHINSTLYQAHMERMQRIRQGLLPMIKLS